MIIWIMIMKNILWIKKQIRWFVMIHILFLSPPHSYETYGAVAPSGERQGWHGWFRGRNDETQHFRAGSQGHDGDQTGRTCFVPKLPVLGWTSMVASRCCRVFFAVFCSSRVCTQKFFGKEMDQLPCRSCDDPGRRWKSANGSMAQSPLSKAPVGVTWCLIC